METLWQKDMGNAIKLKRKGMQQKCSWEERVYVDWQRLWKPVISEDPYLKICNMMECHKYLYLIFLCANKVPYFQHELSGVLVWSTITSDWESKIHKCTLIYTSLIYWWQHLVSHSNLPLWECRCIHRPRDTSGDQITTCRNWVSPSTMWDLWWKLSKLAAGAISLDARLWVVLKSLLSLLILGFILSYST